MWAGTAGRRRNKTCSAEAWCEELLLLKDVAALSLQDSSPAGLDLKKEDLGNHPKVYRLERLQCGDHSADLPAQGRWLIQQQLPSLFWDQATVPDSSSSPLSFYGKRAGDTERGLGQWGFWPSLLDAAHPVFLVPSQCAVEEFHGDVLIFV